jgi:hypothetical protein
MTGKTMAVALAPFLQSFPEVTTLGVRATMADYSAEEREAMVRAHRIFFPTRRFVHLFHAAGKTTFPSISSYVCRHFRFTQHLLFQYLRLPHPRVRAYFGPRQKLRILREFELPVMVSSARCHPAEMHFVASESELARWAHRYNPVLVQQWIDLSIQLLQVWVNYRCLAILYGGGDRGFCGAGEYIDPDGWNRHVTHRETERLVTQGQLNDIAVEWGYGSGMWWLLGVSQPPSRIRTPSGIIHRHQYIGQLVQAGKL